MTIRELTNTPSTTTLVSGELCIIGAGIAGLLLAIRISRGGRKVIVLESGKKYHDPEIHSLNAIEDISARYGRELSGRFRGLGGTSSRWGGRMISISGQETADRPHVGMEAWPIDMAELDKYGEEIERLFGVANGPFENISTLDHGAELSTSAVLGVRWAKCPSYKSRNLSNLLKRELHQNANLEIWLDATACDFSFDRETGHLKGLTARNLAGKTMNVVARSFVLAAGTIETTRLLLFMDRCADGHIFGKNSVLGHYFQDHLKIEVATIERRDPLLSNRYFACRFLNSTRRDLHLELPHRAQVDEATGSAFAYIAMDVAKGPITALKKLMQSVQHRQFDWRDLSVIPQNAGLLTKTAYWRFIKKQLYVPAHIDFKMMVCAEQLPHWDNEISLAGVNDRLGIPKAKFNWRPMESEERTCRTAMARLAEYWRMTKLDRVCPLMWSATSPETALPITSKAEACAHPSGTTRIGTNAKTSIVGTDLHCHAVPNLSVVSASIFPTAGSANPTFTVMKLAYYFADIYLSRI